MGLQGVGLRRGEGEKSGRQGTAGGGARSAPGLGRGGARNGSADTNAGIWP